MAYHHGNLKEFLIQAGDEALNLMGAEALSLRDIAKRAGVSHNAPYRHFHDRNDLIDSIVERSLRELAEQILSAPLLYPATIRLQIQFVGRLFAQLAIHHPRKAHLVFSGVFSTGEKTGPIKACHRLLLLNLESILQEAAQFELLPNTNCKTLALLLMALFRGLGVLYTNHLVGELSLSGDALCYFTDMAAENLLRPHLA